MFGGNPGSFCDAEHLPSDFDWTDPSHVGKPATIRALRFWKEKQDLDGQGLVFKAWFHKKEMQGRPEPPQAGPDTDISKRKTKGRPRRAATVDRDEISVATLASGSGRPAKPQPKRKSNPKQAQIIIPAEDEAPVASSPLPSSSPTLASPTLASPSGEADDDDLLPFFASLPISPATSPATSPAPSPATTRPHSPEPSDDALDSIDLLFDLAQLRLERSVSAQVIPLKPVPSASVSEDPVAAASITDEPWGYLDGLVDDQTYHDLVAAWRAAMKHSVSNHSTSPEHRNSLTECRTGPARHSRYRNGSSGHETANLKRLCPQRRCTETDKTWLNGWPRSLGQHVGHVYSQAPWSLSWSASAYCGRT